MNRLKKFRESMNQSQADLAKAANTSQAQVARIEAGQRPSLKLAKLLCKALNADLGTLFPVLSADVADVGDSDASKILSKHFLSRELSKQDKALIQKLFEGLDEKSILSVIKMAATALESRFDQMP
jgi:transcriptional regulator with XRE-family HTH domain